MGDIHFIVDRLNEPPFSMPLSLVAFDEKSPFELLEIVNAVIREISAEHAANLRDETPEATATRMMDFLFKVLNYQQSLEPEHFKTGLLHGDPGILYPALGWMLERRSELTTRAYLARFLLNVEIPEHMFGDDEILELYQQHKDLQEQFKEAHKASEQSRSQLISPAEIKKAIVQMEEDKEQLERKVEAALWLLPRSPPPASLLLPTSLHLTAATHSTVCRPLPPPCTPRSCLLSKPRPPAPLGPKGRGAAHQAARQRRFRADVARGWRVACGAG